MKQVGYSLDGLVVIRCLDKSKSFSEIHYMIQESGTKSGPSTFKENGKTLYPFFKKAISIAFLSSWGGEMEKYKNIPIRHRGLMFFNPVISRGFAAGWQEIDHLKENRKDETYLSVLPLSFNALNAIPAVLIKHGNNFKMYSHNSVR